MSHNKTEASLCSVKGASDMKQFKQWFNLGFTIKAINNNNKQATTFHCNRKIYVAQVHTRPSNYLRLFLPLFKIFLIHYTSLFSNLIIEAKSQYKVIHL